MKFKGRDALIKEVQNKLNLVVDGQDGPKTWNEINDFINQKNNTFGSISKMIVKLAKAEIGVEEVDGTNCGKRVNEYKSATWLDSEKGWPWCAAFICWLIRESIKGRDLDWKRPRTAGAWDFENWAKKEDNEDIKLYKPATEVKPISGDILVFRFSHIGICTSSPDRTGFIDTIEGNTNGKGSREGGSVLQKTRHISSVRSVIRITS